MRNSSSESLEKAWAARFQRWKGYAISLTGNAADADEVVQEAVMRTVRANPKLPSEQDASNYVLTAVRTATLQLHERRRRLLPLPDGEAGPVEERSDSNPLHMVLEIEEQDRRQELIRKTMEALELLTPQHRQVVELMVLREPAMKLREVAEVQGAPISTIHSRLQAALRELARAVRDTERVKEKPA